MSNIKVNTINDASGGSNAVLYGVAAPTGSMGFRNRIINGDMRIDQRNAGASTTASGYIVDRWQTGSIAGATLTSQQVTDAPAGFTHSFKQTVTASSVQNDYSVFWQPIEANNAIDLAWGTSNGQSVTLSFWVKSSMSGQFNGAVIYYGATNYYYFPTFTVNAANTWQFITLNIPAPPTAAGAFPGALNTAYISVRPIGVFTSGYTGVGAGNTWTTSANYKVAGSVNLASTAGATVQFTGVQFEAGSVATPFERRPYGTELALCQRYYQKSAAQGTKPADGVSGVATNFAAYAASAGWTADIPFPVIMRAAPTMTAYDSVGVGSGNWAYYLGGAFVACSSTTLSATDRSLQVTMQKTTNPWAVSGAYLAAGGYTASAEL